MNKNINCVFCKPNKKLKFHQTDNFIVLFDPYPLIEGHIMIASKEHYGCAGELPEELLNEVTQLKLILGNIIKKAYGEVSFYEHGRAGGCMATDPGNRICHHFHLHALPFSIDLHSQLEREFISKSINEFSKIKPYFEGYGEYLFFENNNGKASFYPIKNQKIPPHYLRTLISNTINKPHRANWETYAKHNERLIVFNTQKLITKNISIKLNY